MLYLKPAKQVRLVINQTVQYTKRHEWAQVTLLPGPYF